MKKIIILLLITFSSCNTPQYKETERCVVSFQFDKCRCHTYDLNKIKRIGDSYDMPLEYCEDLVGFNYKEWVENIIPTSKELKRYYEDACNKSDY